MPEQKPAWAIKAGDLVLDPSTGCWCQVHEVQVQDDCYWFLWGERRPPGSLGLRVAPKATITMMPPTEPVETWDDLLE